MKNYDGCKTKYDRNIITDKKKVAADEICKEYYCDGWNITTTDGIGYIGWNVDGLIL